MLRYLSRIALSSALLCTPMYWTQLSWAQAAGEATLTGKVVDASTKEGIRKATVLAMRNSQAGRGRQSAFTPPEQFSVKTDESGTFRMTGLPAGDYFLTADRQGYLAAELGARSSVSAKAGQEVAAPELKLVRQGVIAGRVVDAEGEPVEFVSIQAIPAGGNTAGMLMRGGVSATTDDRGEFRMARLTPGSYRLLAAPGHRLNATPLGGQDQEPAMLDAPTYFPGSLEESAAAKIPVGSGEERTGVEIRLQRTAVVRVSGRVDGDFPRDVPVPVALQPLGSQLGVSPGLRIGRFGSTHSGTANAEGAFVIANVMPGEYVITANSHNRGQSHSAFAKIRVGQQDVENVQLHMQPPGRIVGHVSGDGGGKGPSQPFHIGLQASETGMPGGAGAMVKPDGTFVMENVVRSRMRLLPTAPNGWYLKSVLVGNQPIQGKEFDLAGPETRLELIFSDQPGAVEGTVRGGEGKSAVLLVPDGNEGAPPQGQWFKNILAEGEQGKFQIDSVAPGSYYVVACPPSAVQMLSDPSVWAKLKEKATRVTVEEKKAATVSLRAVQLEDLEEK
ncbi:MAG TPA: carboxypeptidase-like regulatory domain-containing protein [Bryobacteraceae bacterium]|nr:carboxypeptidase-like regulatory domain-containing protein [Bryobacteraceae bacterium]